MTDPTKPSAGDPTGAEHADTSGAEPADAETSGTADASGAAETPVVADATVGSETVDPASPIDDEAPVDEPAPVDSSAAVDPEPPADGLDADADADADASASTPLPERARRPTFTRARAGIAARIAVGIVGIAVLGGTVVAAETLTLPAVRATPASITVDPIAAGRERVCPGGLLTLGAAGSINVDQPLTIGLPVFVDSASGGSVTERQLAQPDLGIPDAAAAPLAISLPDGADASANVTGSQTETSARADISGIAVAECSEASADSWLVGGATTVGRAAVITLANPSDVDATVTLTVYGEAGEVGAPGTDGIIVAPGTQRVVSLAGLAPGIESPVVHVESRGGLVVANLQASLVRTLQPGGVEIIAASAAPATSATVAGVIINAAEQTTAAQAQPGFEDLTGVVRLLAPGADAADARVTITPEGIPATVTAGDPAAEGPAAGDPAAEDPAGEPAADGVPLTASISFDVALVGGEVMDVPISGLADGSYTVAVESSTNVVAGVRTSAVGSTGASDFAWFAAGVPLDDTTTVIGASDQTTVLRFSNPTDSERTLTITTLDGASELVVPAGSGQSRLISSGSPVTASGVEGLVASVSAMGDGLLSSFAVSPSAARSGPVTVYP